MEHKADSDPILLSLSRHFPVENLSWALAALRQDALIWDALMNRLGAHAIQSLPPDARCWTPAVLGLLSIALEDPGSALATTWQTVLAAVESEDSSIAEAALDDVINHQAVEVFKTWQSSDLSAPVTVATAARLALALRSRLQAKDDWQTLISELDLERAGISTVFTCLYGMVPHPGQMLLELLGDGSNARRVNLVFHAFLCRPQPEKDQEDQLAILWAAKSAAERTMLFGRLAALRPVLAARLAEFFLTAETGPVEDPLECAPGDLGSSFDRMARILRQSQSYELAGQSDRCVPLLAEALRTMRRLRGHLSAALARSVAPAHGMGDAGWRETASETGLEAWKQAVQLAPDTPMYVAGLINALIAANRAEDAKAILAHHQSDAEQDAVLSLAAARLARLQNDPQDHRTRLIQTLHLLDGGTTLTEDQFVQLADGFGELGMFNELATTVGRGLEIYPLSRCLYELLAPAQLALGNSAQALESAIIAQVFGSEKMEGVILSALEAVGAWGPAFDRRLEWLKRIENPTLDDLHAVLYCAEHAGRPDPLEELCRRIFEIAPNDLDAQRAMGIAARDRGEYARAALYFAQVVHLAPDRPELWLALVDAYRQAGQAASAMDTLRAASQAVPDSDQVLKALGQAFLAQNQPTQALASLRRAAALNPQDETILLLGQTLLQLGCLDEASQVLSPPAHKAPPAELDPDLAYAYGRVMIGLGNAETALPYLMEVVRQRPEEVEPCIFLSRSLLEVDDQPASARRAVLVLQRILDLNPDGSDSGYSGRLDGMPILRGEARGLLADAYAAVGETALAMDAYRRALDDPGNRRPAVQARLAAGLGRMALKLDQPEMAVAALQDAAQAEPLNAELQCSLSEAYLSNGLVEESHQAASTAIDLQPENTGILTWFIHLASRLVAQSSGPGQIIRSQMLRAVETASRLEPNRPDILLHLGRIRLEAGNPSGAVEAYRRMAGSGERLSPDVVAEAARNSRTLGETSLAVHLLKNALEQCNDTTSQKDRNALLAELSLAQEANGDLNAALESAEAALVLDEDQPKALVRVAEVLIAQNRSEPALERLQRAVELAPRDPKLRLRAADLLRGRGDWSAALKMSEYGLDVLKDEPDIPEKTEVRRSLSRLAAGLAQITLRPRLALEYLEAAVPENDPAFHDFSNAALRAEIALDLEDLEMAETAVAVMERINPLAPRTQAGLSRIAGRKKMREERDRCCHNCAREIIRNALTQPAITPPSYREQYIADYLASAQASIEARRWEEAETTLNKLIELIPETPLAYFKLAQIAVLRGEAQYLYRDLDVIRHVPGGNFLSGTAPAETEKLIERTQSLLELDFSLEVSEEFVKWDDECRKTLGTWMARAHALFNPEMRSARILETMLRMGNVQPDHTAALIMAYRRCNELDNALQAVDAGWQPANAGQNPAAHPLVLIQLALTDPNRVRALSRAGDALSAAQAEDWPPLPMIHYLNARLASELGVLETAMPAIQQALTAWPDEPRWQELAANIYLKPSAAAGIQDPARALMHLEAAAALDPEKSELHLSIGRIYLSGGQYERALPALEQAGCLDPDCAETWLLLAQAQMAAGNLSAAANSTEHAIAGFGGLVNRGENGAVTGESPRNPALSLAAAGPELVDALLLRGQIALQSDDPQAALECAQVVLDALPDFPEALYLTAHALEGLNRPADALGAIERALPFNPNPLPMQLERARLIRRSQGLDAGITALEDLLEGTPDIAPVLALLSTWYNESGRSDAAVTAARRALSDESDLLTETERAELSLLIGLQMRRTGQLDQAILYLSEAINHAPANLEPYLELGRTYLERREYRQALKVYQKAISVAPGDFRSYYQAGLVLKDSKDYLAAEAMLRRAAQVAPNEVSVHRLLGAVVALNLVHNRHTSSTGS